MRDVHMAWYRFLPAVVASILIIGNLAPSLPVWGFDYHVLNLPYGSDWEWLSNLAILTIGVFPLFGARKGWHHFVYLILALLALAVLATNFSLSMYIKSISAAVHACLMFTSFNANSAVRVQDTGGGDCVPALGTGVNGIGQSFIAEDELFSALAFESRFMNERYDNNPVTMFLYERTETDGTPVSSRTLTLPEYLPTPCETDWVTAYFLLISIFLA